MNASKKREFLDLITVEKAQEIIENSFSWHFNTTKLPLFEARDRILAKDITTEVDIPPFDRSLMDGYAVRVEDTFDIDETNPKIFRVIDSVPAGKISSKTLDEPCTCIEIATGAPIPYGANGVVMVEYTSRLSENEIQFFKPVTSYENIEPAGSDIMYGEIVLRKGDVLTPVRLGILASLGKSEIEVLSRLKVGIMSSGDELRVPGDNLPEGCLYDSNSVVLSSLVVETGAEVVMLGICPDNLDIYKQTVSKHLEKVDILIISGGTSAGEGDYSYRIVTELGGKLLFHGISIKPGKPLSTGLINNKLLVTLPGFPASAIFSFNTVIAPLIRKWTNKPLPRGKKLQATLGRKIRSTVGRKQFKLVHLLKDGSSYRAYPVKGNSGSMSMLERADGYMTIPEEVEYMHDGETVEVTLLREKLLLADIVFTGSHDFVIDQLFQEFRHRYPEYSVKLFFTGSTGGLSAMSRGESDIAGIHLLDSDTQQYNKPYIDKWKLDEKITLVKGYKRKQGLYVRKGNPKNIRGIEDLLRPDITFLNRNEGSGTRILLEYLLEKLSVRRSCSMMELQQLIQGYREVAYSHSATASAVSRQKVDVTMGIESYATQFGLDFIPIKEEEYDFLISNNSIEKESIKKLLDLFSSKDFH
ncbi:MAG: molybdopterin biosynthesis protein [Candidatus Hodarchaeales archaeon]|jgi:putative molybdopterin biosynthesis protein